MFNKILSVVMPRTHRDFLAGTILTTLPNHDEEVRDAATKTLLRCHHDEVTVHTVATMMHQVASRSYEEGACYAFKIASQAATLHERIYNPARVTEEARAIGSLANGAVDTALECIAKVAESDPGRARNILIECAERSDMHRRIRGLARSQLQLKVA